MTIKLSSEATGNTSERELLLSVVVPVYSCARCLSALHERVAQSVSELTDDYELILVDDRSLDGAWDVIRGLARQDPHVRGFRLSRNFGQHAAITAGLSRARGRWAVVMDCDLQEAPEDIPRLFAAAGEGYDVVRTIRRGRRHSRPKRWASRIYRRLTLETDVRPDYSTLSLISRRVIDAFLTLRDRDREYMTALDWLGFESTAIEIEHADRHDGGKSGYTFERLIRVALEGMFFQSTALLKVVVLAGFLIAITGVGLSVFVVIDHFAESPANRVPGYTSLAVLLIMLAGFIIVSVGVVGLYVARIFEQVKGRPLYLIDAEVSGGEERDVQPTPTREGIPAAEALRAPEPQPAARGAGPPART